MDIVQHFIKQAKSFSSRIVYPESTDERILMAAVRAKHTGIVNPVLLGEADDIKKIAFDNRIRIDGIEIISAKCDSDKSDRYAQLYAEERKVKLAIAKRLIKKEIYFGGMMVKCADADGMVAGVSNSTATVIKAASLTIGYEDKTSVPSSFFIIVVPHFLNERNKILFFADCAVNISPNSRQLAEIGIMTAKNAVKLYALEPKIAFLAFSTKGSANHESITKIRKAVEIANSLSTEFIIDGELQVDAAIVPDVAQKKVKENKLAGRANILVFPDLNSGNIGYKLVQYLAHAKAYGPILQGFAKPVNDLSRGASVDDIIAVTAITVVQAKTLNKDDN